MVLVQLGEDFFHRSVESVHGDGTFFAGFHETAEEFLTVQSLAGPIALHYAELGALDLLIGGVAVATLEALATTTRSRPVLRHTRVDDFVFE